MNASEARDHVEMIEKIIAASSQKLEAGGEFFLAWGLVAGTIDLIAQLVLNGRVPQAASWASIALIAAGIVFSIVRSRQLARCGVRMSLLQREFLNVMTLALGMAFVADAIGFALFPVWAQAGLWSVMSALVLFYIGMHGNRRATVGGIILIASIAAANFMPHAAGYVLAAGMYAGYAGFGIADLLASR